MPEGRVRQTKIAEVLDLSAQPAVVSALIAGEESLVQSRAIHGKIHAAIAEEGPKVRALQEEVGRRADLVVEDVLDLARSTFTFDDGDRGFRHPISRKKPRTHRSSSDRFTQLGAEDVVIDDGGSDSALSLAYRRTTQGKNVVAESVTITKRKDPEFVLGMSIAKVGRDSTINLRAKNGHGWQELTRISPRQGWRGKEQRYEGHEAQGIWDVLVAFGWVTNKLRNPVAKGEIVKVVEEN